MHTVFCVFGWADCVAATFALWPTHNTECSICLASSSSSSSSKPKRFGGQLHQLLAVYITMAACHFSGRGQQERRNTVLNLMHDHIKRSHMQHSKHTNSRPEALLSCPFIRFSVIYFATRDVDLTNP